MITFTNVTKTNGRSAFALRDCSFTVDGECLAILGAVGAGKTAVADILCGITEPSSGKVMIDDISADSRKAAEAVGYMPEKCPLSPALTLWESLCFTAKLRGLSEEAAEEALSEAEAEAVADLPVGRLDLMGKKRASLAYALLGSPKYLVLDQPISGLNEEEEREMIALIKSLSEKYVYIYLSDTLSDAQALCGQALLLSAGKTVAEGSFERLLDSESDAADYKLRARGDVDALKSALSENEGVLKYKISITSSGTSLIDISFFTKGNAEAELRALLTEAGQKIVEVRKTDSPIEKVISALLERQDEKEQARRAAEAETAPPVDMKEELKTMFGLDADDDVAPEDDSAGESGESDNDDDDESDDRYSGEGSTLF